MLWQDSWSYAQPVVLLNKAGAPRLDIRGVAAAKEAIAIAESKADMMKGPARLREGRNEVKEAGLG